MDFVLDRMTLEEKLEVCHNISQYIISLYLRMLQLGKEDALAADKKTRPTKRLGVPSGSKRMVSIQRIIAAGFILRNEVPELFLDDDPFKSLPEEAVIALTQSNESAPPYPKGQPEASQYNIFVFGIVQNVVYTYQSPRNLKLFGKMYTESPNFMPEKFPKHRKGEMFSMRFVGSRCSCANHVITSRFYQIKYFTTHPLEFLSANRKPIEFQSQ